MKMKLRQVDREQHMSQCKEKAPLIARIEEEIGWRKLWGDLLDYRLRYDAACWRQAALTGNMKWSAGPDMCLGFLGSKLDVRGPSPTSEAGGADGPARAVARPKAGVRKELESLVGHSRSTGGAPGQGIFEENV